MNHDDEDAYARLRRMLRIDHTRIDEEIMELPMLLQDAAELAAKLGEAERIVAHDYEITKAEVAAEMRRVLDGGKPPSEASIASALNGDERVQAARREVELARRDTEIAKALAGNMHEKSSLIRKTADLMLAGYITPASIVDRNRQELGQARQLRRHRDPD